MHSLLEHIYSNQFKSMTSGQRLYILQSLCLNNLISNLRNSISVAGKFGNSLHGDGEHFPWFSHD